MSATDFPAMLSALLESAETWVPGAERTLVSQGLPAADCGLLAVWCERLDAGPVAKTGCHVEPRAWLHVTYYGCAPVAQRDGQPPTAEAISENALAFADVGMSIWAGIVAGATSGTLIDGLSCTSVDLTQGMRCIAPQGGMAGWDATIIVSLT